MAITLFMARLNVLIILANQGKKLLNIKQVNISEGNSDGTYLTSLWLNRYRKGHEE